jgi:phosphoribosylcarboxyaminoimidazole (NCAIR) mutase
LLATAILALKRPELAARLDAYRSAQTAKVLAVPDPSQPDPRPAS